MAQIHSFPLQFDPPEYGPIRTAPRLNLLSSQKGSDKIRQDNQHVAEAEPFVNGEDASHRRHAPGGVQFRGKSRAAGGTSVMSVSGRRNNPPGKFQRQARR